MTEEDRTAWIATQRGRLYILTEQSLSNKIFRRSTYTGNLIINKGGQKTELGEFLNIGLSPESLFDDLVIIPGDKVLIVPSGRKPVGSGVAG